MVGTYFQICNKWCKERKCSITKCPANDGFSSLNCTAVKFHSLCTSSTSTFIMLSPVTKLRKVL